MVQDQYFRGGEKIAFPEPGRVFIFIRIDIACTPGDVKKPPLAVDARQVPRMAHTGNTTFVVFGNSGHLNGFDARGLAERAKQVGVFFTYRFLIPKYRFRRLERFEFPWFQFVPVFQGLHVVAYIGGYPNKDCTHLFFFSRPGAAQRVGQTSNILLFRKRGQVGFRIDLRKILCSKADAEKQQRESE